MSKAHERISRPISAAERVNRLAATRDAKASGALEGFSITAELEGALSLYDEGRISFDDLLNAAKEVGTSRRGAALATAPRRNS